jgi:hypothetical protein
LFGSLERNTLRPWENKVVLVKYDLACVSLSFFLFLTPMKWCLPESFIAQGQVVTISPKARQVASGQVKSYVIWSHWPGVANNIFNAWECPVLSPTLLYSVSSVAPCRYIAGHCSGAWRAAHSTGAMLQSHYSYLSDGAACPELLNHPVL